MTSPPTAESEEVVRWCGVALAALSLFPLAVMTKWERLREKDFERKRAILSKYGSFVDKTEDKVGQLRQGITFVTASEDQDTKKEGEEKGVEEAPPAADRIEKEDCHSTVTI